MAGLQHELGQANQGKAGNAPDGSRTRLSSRWWQHCSLAAALLACAAPGCGKDEEKTSGSSANTTKAGAGGGSAGSSGSAGGTATGTAPKPVACGESQCTVNNPLSGLLGAFGGFGNATAALPMAVACCLDEGAGTCGIAMGEGGTCEAKATPDSSCPGINVMAPAGLGAAAGGLGMMAGCCIDDACGQDGQIFGRGCVENSQAAGMISGIPLIGMFITVPAAQECGLPPPAAGSGGSGGAAVAAGAAGAAGKSGAGGGAAGKSGAGGSAAGAAGKGGSGGAAGAATGGAGEAAAGGTGGEEPDGEAGEGGAGGSSAGSAGEAGEAGEAGAGGEGAGAGGTEG